MPPQAVFHNGGALLLVGSLPLRCLRSVAQSIHQPDRRRACLGPAAIRCRLGFRSTSKHRRRPLAQTTSGLAAEALAEAVVTRESMRMWMPRWLPVAQVSWAAEG